MKQFLAAAALIVGLPALASAQYQAPGFSRESVGEKYKVEVGGTMWNSAPAGTVSSEQFGLVGSNIDFVKDLGFHQTRFRDVQFAFKPGKKHHLRAQYTPIEYTSDTVFKRTIVFNGQAYPVNVPVATLFDWKVWRVGYEYDVVQKERGYVGFLLEGRVTQFQAALNSPLATEFTSVRAPLPAIGVVGRAYIMPNIAIHFELSGMKIPKIQQKYEAHYYDWDIHGIVNMSRYMGAEIGFRKMSTYIALNKDKGNMTFQGVWFGAALRY